MQNFRVKLFVVLLLGTVTVFGFAPFYFFLVPVFSLALLFFFWRNSASALQSAQLGFTFGMGLFGAGVTWIYVSLHDFGGMPMPVAVLALLLLCAYLSLFPALTGWLSTRLHMLPGVMWLLFVAALWMLSEWLRGTLFTGFPWLSLGYSQVPFSPLAGFAPVLGVYGTTLVLVLSSLLLLMCFESGARVWHYLVPLVAIWLGGYGLQQIEWVKPEGEPVTVSLLQGNIAQDLKWREDHVITTMETYAQLIHESSSRLIVTPEISIPLFNDVVPPAFLDQLEAHARKNNGDVLIGLVEHAPAGYDEYYNSMFSFGVSPNQRYRKHHLVPFGEFVPLKPVFGWIIHILDIPLSDFSRGSLDQQPMHLAGQRVAVNICYEDVFGEEIINQLPQASLLVNVSNDAWFGRSIGPQQHLQISQMRALEAGRYMLRATNTGVTAIINQRGEVLQEVDVFIATALHSTAQGYVGETLYVRFGNSLALGLAGFSMLIAVLLLLRGFRKTL